MKPLLLSLAPRDQVLIKEAMKWSEITLRGVQTLQLHGKRVGIVERRQSSDRIDGLVIHFDGGAQVELRAAGDVSEQLECPRVFVVEGVPQDTLLFFGGEKAY